MREPLLGVPLHYRSANEEKRSKSTLLSMALLPLRWLRHWWQVTTNPSYLQSSISRRASLKVILPAFSAAGTILDAMAVFAEGEDQVWRIAVDLPFLIGFCAYAFSSIGTNNLLVDAIIATLIASSFSLYPFQFAVRWIPVYIILGCFVGLHSFAILVIWAAAFLMSWQAMGAEDAQLDFIITTTLLLVGCIGMEYTLARLHIDLQKQLQCNHMLLDGATDGFGVVDVVSGVVLEASPKMHKTLGSRKLVGLPLQSGLHSARDVLALTALFGAGEGASPPAPIMVTWSSETSECEVRIIPYELLGSRIVFCVQRVGEARNPRSAAAAVTGLEVTRVPLDLEVQAEEVPAEVAAAVHGEESRNNDAGEGSCANAAPPQAGFLGKALPLPKSLGTLSLSSWTVSHEGSRRGGQARAPPLPAAGKRVVDTRTVGVQASAQVHTPLPPAPLAASTVPKPEQEREVRQKRLKRVLKSRYQEGKPFLSAFAATPQSTWGNSLRNVVRSFNIHGKGCCSRHLVWVALHKAIMDELIAPCGQIDLCKGWQCSQCYALNDNDPYASGDEDEEHEQMCSICHDLVEPLFPREAASRESVASLDAASDDHSDRGGLESAGFSSDGSADSGHLSL